MWHQAITVIWAGKISLQSHKGTFPSKAMLHLQIPQILVKLSH